MKTSLGMMYRTVLGIVVDDHTDRVLQLFAMLLATAPRGMSAFLAAASACFGSHSRKGVMDSSRFEEKDFYRTQLF